jgi:hypothetical protein
MAANVRRVIEFDPRDVTVAMTRRRQEEHHTLISWRQPEP